MVESVLGRVLEAFQTGIAAAMAGSAVAGLANNAALARLMTAGEPVDCAPCRL